MDFVEPKKCEDIIKPEFERFAKSAGFYDVITSDSRSAGNTSRRLVCKLFCKKYAEAIWFQDGNLYKVRFDSSTVNGPMIEVYQYNPVSPLFSEYKFERSNAYRNAFFILILIAGFLTSSTPYFFLVIFGSLVFFLSEEIETLFYKMRVSFFKR